MDADFANAWLPSAAACHHGSRCSCRAFARALGIPESAIDFNYCRLVLQKHWRMNCDHLPLIIEAKETIQLPPHESDDPVHMILLANADRGSGEPVSSAGT